jgi:hypothetical protein
MYVSVNKQPIRVQSCFGVLSRFCQGNGQNTVYYFKYPGGQHNAVSLHLQGRVEKGMSYITVRLCSIVPATTKGTEN